MVTARIEDLDAIAQYISADSSAYAATIVKTILNTTRNLSAAFLCWSYRS
jgi:hypothetical protein